MERIKFTDYEKIVDYLKAMRSILLIITKYNNDLSDKEWVHLKLAYSELEQELTEQYDDLDIHFYKKNTEEKIKSIDFLLALFEIGRNAKVTI